MALNSLKSIGKYAIVRSQHPLLAAIADKIQTMDAKDTLKYTVGLDIVTDMLKMHAKQLIMNQMPGNQMPEAAGFIKLLLAINRLISHIP